MTSRDIIAKLKEDGWVLVHTRGSHHHYKHPQKDIPIGTLRSIFKQAGLTWKDRK